MVSFKGGVHPPEEKGLTASKGIETPPLPKRVIIPFSQHTGAPSKPIVKKGDEVKTGEKIGEIQGKISVPTHATISGKVLDIKEFPHPVLGSRSLACIIESDGKDEWISREEREDYLNLSPSQLIEIVKEAGIVGLGGAAFPTHIKLSPPKDKPIDTLIINGCECEPYLTADHRLMLENTEGILKGAEILKRILNPKRVIIAIEDNKPDAIEKMEKSAKGFEVIKLKTKYPEGAEKQLIYALTRREVPSGGLPMDVGCLVQNVGTTLAVYEAVRFSKPLIERVLTVTGDGIREPKNLRVRIGTPIKDLIDVCGGYREPPAKVILGGPMMGLAQYSDELPVVKGTSGILILTPKTAEVPQEGPCLRCARCVDACPMNLLPCEIAKFIEHREFSKARDYGVLDCIECGCCAYVCPSKIRLVHLFKFGKSEIRRLG